MIVKRAAELRLLEEQYAMEGNNFVVLYGRKGMGKTTLINEFIKDRELVYYYEGIDCEEQLQLHFMSQRAGARTKYTQYFRLFSDLIEVGTKKAIIILDEFHYIIKNSPDIIDSFQLLNDKTRSLMIVLCSSSVRWVENEMVGSLGEYSASISAYLKLKEFAFVDFVNYFSKSSVETCIYINAILGGIPEYLMKWQEDLSVKNNIIHILLNKDSGLFYASQQLLRLELREPAVYNTILYHLAQGNRKLNELHAKTGFSRAKISVYLKNLIHLDVVEKLVPLGEEGKENAKKGLYRIRDNYLNFWYRFVFSHLSELVLGQAEQVYDGWIAPWLDDYVGEYFADVCMEYLKLMNQYHRLPEKFFWWDRWYGKNGTIDILAQGDNKKTLLGSCLWKDKVTGTDQYQYLLELAREAKVNPDYCYLFSRNDFSKELALLAEEQQNIILIGLKDL